MDTSKDKRQGTPVVSRVLPDGRLLELVYDAAAKRTQLALYDGTDTVLVDELEVGTELLVPLSASNSLIRHEAIVFPERPEPYGDVQTLVADIEAYLARYVSISDSFRRLSAYYALFSFVYDAFEELPYLRVQAEFGSGKTRALIVIGSLCYRAFFASGASTVSPIFHTLDTHRGTLVLDEADFRFSDKTSELTKILNNGNVRGFPVFRTAITLKREFDPRAFQVYGPKLVAMRQSFSDEALESRFITERMDRVRVGAEIPLNLPPAQRVEAQALRNKLLQYRFDHRLTLRADPALVDPSLSPRSNQILVPLLSVVPNEAHRQEIRALVQATEQEHLQARSATTDADLLQVVLDLAGEADTVSVSDLCAHFAELHQSEYDRPLTSRYIGSLLRTRLGLSTYKSNGVYLVSLDHERLSLMAKRYGVRKTGERAAEASSRAGGDSLAA